MSGPVVVVHHLERSRSHRILWMLEELEHPYEMKVYQRDPKTSRAGDDLKRVHPLGHAPVVSIDGVVWAESGAIIETLTEVIPGGEGLRSARDSADFRRYRTFLHYAEGSLMTPLLVALIIGKVRHAPVPFFIRPIVKGIAGQVDKSYTLGELANHTAFLDGELAQRDYFAGDTFTAADIQMSYGIEALMSRGKAEAPRLTAWLERVRARPAYQRALAKGGPVLL